MKEYRYVPVERYLNRLKRPGRYVGKEWNIPDKDFEKADVQMVMAFPDLYEVGMSHLGLRILYEVVNNHTDFAMERVMAPGVDLEEILRAEETPLFTLETGRAVGDFDVLGFSIQYELCVTNILNMLDLSGIPLRAEKRDHRHPIVIGGGPCVYNPEPFAPFFDVMFIGEHWPRSAVSMFLFFIGKKTAEWFPWKKDFPRRSENAISKIWTRRFFRKNRWYLIPRSFTTAVWWNCSAAVSVAVVFVRQG